MPDTCWGRRCDHAARPAGLTSAVRGRRQASGVAWYQGPLFRGEGGVLLGLGVVARQVAEQDVLPGLEVHGQLGAPAPTSDPVVCIAGLLVRGERSVASPSILGARPAVAARQASVARLRERLERFGQAGSSRTIRGIRIAEAHHLKDRIGHVAPHQPDRTAALIDKSHLN